MDFKNIKVIVSDIDGTLLNDNQEVSLNTIDAIKKIKAKGMLFGLCSGRETNSMMNVARKWKIIDFIDFIVSHGGVEVHDYLLNQVKTTFLLDQQIMQEIVNHFQNLNVNFVVPDNGILFASRLDGYIKSLSRFDYLPFEVVDFNKFLNKPRNKIMIVCHPSYMNKVIERSKTFKSKWYQGTPIQTEPFILEYMHHNVCKSNGLKLFLEDHHLTMNQVCAFGDGTNDYDLILHAGIGVAMKNGADITKSVANFITDDNNHNGIANFINSHW